MTVFDPTRNLSGTDEVWTIEGISAEAVAWAESEAARRQLTLAEWIEEAIERALMQQRATTADDHGR